MDVLVGHMLPQSNARHKHRIAHLTAVLLPVGVVDLHVNSQPHWTFEFLFANFTLDQFGVRRWGGLFRGFGLDTRGLVEIMDSLDVQLQDLLSLVFPATFFAQMTAFLVCSEVAFEVILADKLFLTVRTLDVGFGVNR